MGCWNETCFVTRTPIHYNDPVVMVVLRQGYNASWLIQFDSLCSAVEQIEFGTYNDYGWIEEIDGARSEDTKQSEPYQRAIFLHRAVWDKIQGMDLSGHDPRSCVSFESILKYVDQERQTKRILFNFNADNKDPKPDELWEKIRLLVKVLFFCSQCRIDPANGLAFKGSQNTDLWMHAKLLEIEQDAWAAWGKMEKERENL